MQCRIRAPRRRRGGYGASSPPTTAGESADPSPKTQSLPAIDRDGFDHDAYVTESVRDVPLAELQARCVSMAGEIKQLDGDMQMLVYENYSKFIVATDTVKHMRTNVDTIEGRVEELTTSVDATAAKAEAVNEKLGSHREQIEQLNGVRALIKKLQAVFDLPAKLRTCAETGALALAVKYYVGAKPLLAKYGEEGAFAGVKQECDAAMTAVEGKLRAGFDDAATAAAARRKKRREMHENQNDGVETPNADDDNQNVEESAVSSSLDASECVELLERLGAPAGELQGAYLASRAVAMESALGDAEQTVSTSAVTDPRAFVVSLSATFLEDFRETAGEYAELFKDREPLVSLGRTLLQRYFAVVKRGLAGGAGTLDVTPAKGLMAALAQMAADLSGINRLVPEITVGRQGVRGCGDGDARAGGRRVHGPGAQASGRDQEDRRGRRGEGDERRGRTRRVFAPMLRRALRRFTRRRQGGSGGYQVVARGEARDGGVVAGGVRVTRPGARHVHAGRAARQADARVRHRPVGGGGRLESLQASPLAPPSTRGAAPAPLLLVFARLASFMETDGVPHIARELQSFFPTSSEVNQSLFVEEAARVKSAGAADALVRAYVDLSARRLSLMIRQSIAMCEWNGMNEPRDVRSVASFVVTDLEAVEGETRLILEDGGHGSGADDVPGGGSGIKPLTGIERGVADLFRDKDSGRVFSETVDPTQASVLGAVTKSALKSFTECVRTVPSFNRCGVPADTGGRGVLGQARGAVRVHRGGQGGGSEADWGCGERRGGEERRSDAPGPVHRRPHPIPEGGAVISFS